MPLALLLRTSSPPVSYSSTKNPLNTLWFSKINWPNLEKVEKKMKLPLNSGTSLQSIRKILPFSVTSTFLSPSKFEEPSHIFHSKT